MLPVPAVEALLVSMPLSWVSLSGRLGSGWPSIGAPLSAQRMGYLMLWPNMTAPPGGNDVGRQNPWFPLHTRHSK